MTDPNMIRYASPVFLGLACLFALFGLNRGALFLLACAGVYRLVWLAVRGRGEK